MASLPEVVQRQGIMVSKSTRNYLLVVGLISEDGSMDGNDLRDYAQSSLEKVLARVPDHPQAMKLQAALEVFEDKWWNTKRKDLKSKKSPNEALEEAAKRYGID